MKKTVIFSYIFLLSLVFAGCAKPSMDAETPPVTLRQSNKMPKSALPKSASIIKVKSKTRRLKPKRSLLKKGFL